MQVMSRRFSGRLGCRSCSALFTRHTLGASSVSSGGATSYDRGPVCRTQMKRGLGVLVGVVAFASVTSAQTGLSVAEQNEITRTRCAVCHTDAKPLGGLSLEHFDAAQPDPALARMMLVKIKDDGAITASGAPKPPPETYDAFMSALQSYALRPPADPRWTVQLNADPAMPNRGHSVVTARAELPSGHIVLTCNGASRHAEMTTTAKSGEAAGSIDFDGLSPTVRAIFSWCLAK
jgi:hypothetical protein